MTFAEDLCTYLAEHHDKWDDAVVDDGFQLNVDADNVPAETVSVVSDVLYLNRVPDDKTDCICIYDTSGTAPIRLHGTEKPINNPTAQIRIRNSRSRVARETAVAIHELLDEQYLVEVSDRVYISINSNGPPYYLGTDQVSTSGQAHEYTLNLYSRIKL